MNSRKSKYQCRRAAERLIRDAEFLFRVGRKIDELGVVGENRNRLILFLAGLTKDFDKPVSIIEKGVSSTGKSELMKAVIALFPPECVLTRASMSKMAPVHGSDELSGKILYLIEFRAAKDASYLTRLLQSEGQIDHEYTTIAGHERGTAVASRRGSPVVLTTTTRDRVFEDDETRFLSIRADDSAEQTEDFIVAHFNPSPTECVEEGLRVWHEAVRLLCKKIPRFRHPEWFTFLAREIPSDEPRARRDAVRFLSLLKTVALCRSHSDGRYRNSQTTIEIDLADYCVAHRILSRAFASTFAGVHPQVLELAKGVRRLHKELRRPVAVKELAHELGWDQALIYKYVKSADKQKLVQYEIGSRQFNQKRILPGLIARPGFLPDPKLIFQNCKEVGEEVRYVDPITGKSRVMRRSQEAEL